MAKSPYILNINGLEAGEHLFRFELDDKFLEIFPIEEVTQLAITVEANLIKQNNVMKVDFLLDGYITVPCDRCLAYNPLPISQSESLVIKFGDPDSSDDEVLFIEQGETQIDVGKFLFEYIFTAIPARKIPCEIENNEAKCDESVLRKLKENSTFDDSSSENDLWKELNKLKKSNKN
ncbi:MAG: DUF177 domain-containing protein [Bacteroidia bacterium]